MTKTAADRMTMSVAAFGLAISLGALGFRGVDAAISTGVGAVLALLNLLALRILVVRVVAGDTHTKLPLMVLVFVKMGLLMGLVYWFIARHWVEPIAFTVGLSSLSVGLITGSLLIARSGPNSEF